MESKKKLWKWTYKTENHRLRKGTHSCWGERIVKDFGKVMYTMLYLKWITNRNLLYSTWNSAQCYLPFWTRGARGTMYTYVYVAESLHYSPEAITTLIIGYTPTQSALGGKKLKNKIKRCLFLLYFCIKFLSVLLHYEHRVHNWKYTNEKIK